MSSILDELLNQTAVYWPPTKADSHGVVGHGTPVEIPGKWSSSSAISITSEGTTKGQSADFYTSVEVETGGWLWRGELVDAPDKPPKKNKITSVQRTDDVDNEETLYGVSL